MSNAILASNLTEIIRKAKEIDEEGLKVLRKKIIVAVNTFGAKTFVNVAAEVLKNNFRIEGCNDARVSLKHIFNISLDELERDLSNQRYNLPSEHPISILSTDHKNNIKKLKALRFSLGKLNLNTLTPVEQIKEKLNQTKDYFIELDSHIRKEEDIIFPALEENGMQEHPQNLREEHKNFREALLKIVNNLERVGSGNLNLFEEISHWKEKFVLDISNHIFRETYIFYPATLEFIKDTQRWEEIKRKFTEVTV